MSREILFKAKRKDDGEWVEGYYVNIAKINPFIATGKIKLEESLEGNFVPEMYAIDPFTICQYTGLKDKNGKKIWENDIVANKWCFVCGNSVVKFGEYKDYHMRENYQCGNLGFYLEHTHNSDKNCRKDMMYFAGKCEVLGNIFDNPELLEGSAEAGHQGNQDLLMPAT